MFSPELQSFLSNTGVAAPLAEVDSTTLAQELKSVVSHAQAAWPEIDIETSEFIGYLGEKVADSSRNFASLLTSLRELEVADLYLAYACSIGNSIAIHAFEAKYFGGIAAALSRLGLLHFKDEVIQQVRHKLFVAAQDSDPPIAHLAGKGHLGGLVRVIAVRSGLNLKRRDIRMQPQRDEDMALLLAEEDGPGIQSIKAEQRGLFKLAFQSALGGLDDQSRAVLRLHLLHQMNISDIAELYDVHRATTGRWIAQIRDDLGQQTRDYLRQERKLNSGDVASLMQIVQSQIDISFTRILGTGVAQVEK